MKNAIIIILAICLGILVVHETFVSTNRERIKWVESSFSISPSKKWAVCFRTTSNSDPAKSFSQILLFDAPSFPDIVSRNYPTRRQLNNPTASFLVPLQLYARVAAVEFTSDGKRVMIKQGPVNHQVPITYELDLDNFSLNSVDPDSSEKPISSNPIFKALCKYWVSKFKTVSGKKYDFDAVYTLKLKPDSTAETWYKPDNYHKGRWLLQSDSSFVLCLKMLEEFKIRKVTDSILIVDTKWDNENVTIEFGAKISSDESASSLKGNVLNDSGSMFTICLGLFPPYETNGVKLQKMLKAEGYESYSEGEEVISMVVSERQLTKLFHARIRYQQVAASASNGFISEPFLEEVKIPGRFTALIRRVYFDPQGE